MAGDRMINAPEDIPASPGVHFPPPFLFVAGVALASACDRLIPLPISRFGGGGFRVGCAALLVGAGIAGVAWALVTFAGSGTAIFPNRPASTLVRHGPYKHSRNPMYVSLAFLQAGLALVLDNAWVLLFVPAVLWALTTLVISREERYLSRAFEAEYALYCARVRRWL